MRSSGLIVIFLLMNCDGVIDTYIVIEIYCPDSTGQRHIPDAYCPKARGDGGHVNAPRVGARTVSRIRTGRQNDKKRCDREPFKRHSGRAVYEV